MSTENSLLLLGVVGVGLWWYRKNNGGGFLPVQRSRGLEGDPTSFNVSRIQNANWWAKWRNATPTVTAPTGAVSTAPTISGTWHL